MAASNVSSVRDLIAEVGANFRGISTYNKFKAVKVKVVAEKKNRKCIEFIFDGNDVSVGQEKLTWAYAAADETGVLKITVDEKCLSEIGIEMTEGKTYIVKNFGVVSSMREGTVQLYLRPSSKIYRSGSIEISDEIAKNAARLLLPQSPVKGSLQEATSSSLFTVEGRISVLSAVRRVETADGPLPIRQVEVRGEDGSQVPVTLWREAALQHIEANMCVSISHCRLTKSPTFGNQAASTQYTEIKEVAAQTRQVSLTINGVALSVNEVLISTLEGGDLTTSVDILKEMVPGVDVEEMYELLPLKVDVSLEGEKIVKVYH